MSLEKEKIKNLISMGTELGGSIVGGALGFLAAGPVGAAGAGAAGVVLCKLSNFVLSDVVDRTLSKREQVRVGAAAAFAIEKMKQYLESGRLLRNDDFFQIANNHRPNAEEIFEGVLLKSKNEHEEKKVRYISNIFANVAFMSDISINEANHILNIADRLTYRQICLLALFFKKDTIENLNLRENNYNHRTVNTQDQAEIYTEITYETDSTIQEIYDLYNQGLLWSKDPDSEEGHALLDAGWVSPNTMLLTEFGDRLCNVMGLFEVSEEDIRTVTLCISY